MGDARTDAEKLVGAWNAMVSQVNQMQPPKMGLATVKTIDEGRRKKINLRLGEYGLPAMLEAVETVGQSTFLRGLENDHGKTWRADFDFLLQPKSIRKVVDLVWPRNIEPGLETAYGPGTSVDRRSVEHSERVRRAHADSMAGLE